MTFDDYALSTEIQIDGQNNEVTSSTNEKIDTSIGGTSEETLGNLQESLLNNFSSNSIELVGSVLLELKEELRGKVVEWATKLIVQETSEQLNSKHKTPRFQSEKPKNDQFLDFDLDNTIENLIEDPTNKRDALRVFNRARSGHSALLIIDSSYSMSGTKLVMAAATVATLMHVFETRDIGIIHFGTNGNVLKSFDSDYTPEFIIEKIFSLNPTGFTNLHAGIKKGISELGIRKNSLYTAILLSDCDINTGKNPFMVAWQLKGLNIITFPPKKGINEFIAKRLVKETKGSLYHAEKVKDIPNILKKILKQ